ncbi:MAG: type II secretion system protein [Acidimicrobiia bacterium]|nr:type II secretion system protein [Acidimicrobiia bacterium]
MESLHSRHGFTLIETLVAIGILITALAGVAQLLVLGAQLARRSTVSGVALRAAQNKLEQLRGLTFAFDASGAPKTTPGLEPSSSASLSDDEPSYYDWLDASGEAQQDEGDPAFVRRWRVTAIEDSSPEALAIEVCVFVAPAEGRGPQSAEACLSTIRTRQP